ncbi:LytR/AlgR family response regulator transcription factor [Pedobacter sp. UBA5917]|jgi:two-component system LytT family response regulator|uniref:LytR/AlgR family response regulator transcription factor n=1 Tax=Pedobacter sp. UBA5917 TaxID=1947061 RepID=UPI0025F244B4|nr:LytTR family transcriptional regulator DNA-binding domain-containing protein [Pedobacter sp. UBA5917]
MLSTQNQAQKLIISNSDYIHVVQFDEIVFCQSDGCYTHINLHNGQKHTLAKSLSKICTQLSSNQFIRISQTYLINKAFVNKIDRKKKNLYLLNHITIPFTISLKNLMDLISDSIHPKINLTDADNG